MMDLRTDPVSLEILGMWDVGLRPNERRALCSLAHLDPSVAGRSWRDLQVDQRMCLVRAMVDLVEFAETCAALLQRARALLQ